MSDRNLNALKTLVISMGIVLVIGFLVVGAAVWMKMKAASPELASNAVTHVGLPAKCPGGSVDFKGRGRVMDSAIEGSLMRMAFVKSDGELEIVHVDLCSGKELSALKVKTDGQ